ncbi:unnamed protein product, partial [Tetraodon nigroviridis]
ALPQDLIHHRGRHAGEPAAEAAERAAEPGVSSLCAVSTRLARL